MSEFKAWIWPDVSTRRQVHVAIQEGSWAAILVAALIAFTSLIGFLIDRELGGLLFPFLETILFVCLAIGISNRSRAAAVAAFTIYVLQYLFMTRTYLALLTSSRKGGDVSTGTN